MPYWLFSTLLVLAVVAVVGPVAWGLTALSRRAADRRALKEFPGDDQEEQRATYALLRQLEGPGPRWRWMSGGYLRRARRDRPS